MHLPEMKQLMEQCLRDMPGIDAERVVYKIRAARSASELWLLRSDMYQAISKKHSQTEAAQRINQLLPCFKRWLPANQLSKI